MLDPNSPSPYVSEQIRQIRATNEHRKTTTRQLSESSGVPKATLDRYMAGSSPWPLDPLFAVCESLGVDAVDVLKAASARRDIELGRIAPERRAEHDRSVEEQRPA